MTLTTWLTVVTICALDAMSSGPSLTLAGRLVAGMLNG